MSLDWPPTTYVTVFKPRGETGDVVGRAVMRPGVAESALAHSEVITAIVHLVLSEDTQPMVRDPAERDVIEDAGRKPSRLAVKDPYPAADAAVAHTVLDHLGMIADPVPAAGCPLRAPACCFGRGWLRYSMVMAVVATTVLVGACGQSARRAAMVVLMQSLSSLSAQTMSSAKLVTARRLSPATSLSGPGIVSTARGYGRGRCILRVGRWVTAACVMMPSQLPVRDPISAAQPAPILGWSSVLITNPVDAPTAAPAPRAHHRCRTPSMCTWR